MSLSFTREQDGFTRGTVFVPSHMSARETRIFIRSVSLICCQKCARNSITQNIHIRLELLFAVMVFKKLTHPQNIDRFYWNEMNVWCRTMYIFNKIPKFMINACWINSSLSQYAAESIATQNTKHIIQFQFDVYWKIGCEQYHISHFFIYPILNDMVKVICAHVCERMCVCLSDILYERKIRRFDQLHTLTMHTSQHFYGSLNIR